VGGRLGAGLGQPVRSQAVSNPRPVVVALPLASETSPGCMALHSLRQGEGPNLGIGAEAAQSPV
jgi:hypothetical protein